MNTYHGKLVAKKDGIYTTYVFQLDDSSYIMCTELPNFSIKPQLQDEGFFTVEEVRCGDLYQDRNTGATYCYKFDNIYLKEFIKDNKTDALIL